VSEDRRGR